MLKCSRCRHVFAAPSSSKKRTPARAPAVEKAAPPADDSLKLPFDDPTWKDDREPSPSEDLKISDPEEDFTLGVDEKPDELRLPEAPPREAAPPLMARPIEDEALAMDNQPDDEAESGEETDVDAELNHEETAARPRAPARPRARTSSSITPILIFLALVVVAYALLTRALFASPALCQKLVGRLPLINRLGDSRLLTRKVALSEVVGSYQRIKDGKEVFVITGKALNTAPLALHSVQIAGKLYNGGGQALDEKVIYCGNVVSAKMLKDLSPREVSILQKLSPPKRFMIEPGESSTFVIVFMDPPRDAAEFSAQVMAAQHQT